MPDMPDFPLILLVSIFLAYLLTWTSTYWAVRYFKSRKLGQTIREDGPQGHLVKAGTPSLAGLFFILPTVLILLFFYPRDSLALIIALVGYGLLGLVDDLINIRQKKSEGLTPGGKFLGQLFLAFLLSALVTTDSFYLFRLSFLFTSHLLKYLLGVVLLVAMTNALNLTDGVDGLCASVSLPPFLALAGLAFYLGQPHIGLAGLLISASLLAFLFFNRHPARIFMGDVGSLALGGLMATMAMALGLELSLLLLGLVYLIETLSVIIQVAYFKKTGGKRWLKMSPLHHHFEIVGWSEKTIVRRFSLVSLLGALLALLLFFI